MIRKSIITLAIIEPTALFAIITDPLSPMIGKNLPTYTPDYLSVPKFEKCLGKEAVQNAILWCLPKEKPKSCPIKSWEKLQTVNLVPCMSDQNIYTAEQMPGIVIPKD